MTIDMPVFGSTNRLLMAVFNDFFAGQDIQIRTLYSEGMSTPAIIARGERRSGTIAPQSHDERYLKPVVVSVNTLTSGLEAESDGEALQEMVRIAITQAQLRQTVFPGVGHISKIENSTVASSASDWATSTGITQYAQLPKGVVRWESVFRLLIRPPVSGSVNNRFRPLA